MQEDPEPRLILYQNEASNEEYEEVKSQLAGIKYEEVDSDERFNHSPISGSPVLGVNTSIGYVPHKGLESIEEVIDVLESSSGNSEARV